MIVGISEAICLLLILFIFLINTIKLNFILNLKRDLFIFNHLLNILLLINNKNLPLISGISSINGNGENEQSIKIPKDSDPFNE
jgi:hypothetical protein